MVEDNEVEKEVTLTKVQIIRRKSEYALVEWEVDGTLQRAWVPYSKIIGQVDTGNIVEVELPGEWPPYGERWDLLYEISQVTPELLDRELRRRGIWTIEDLLQNPSAAKLVLSKLYGLDVVKMLNTAALKQQATGGNP